MPRPRPAIAEHQPPHTVRRVRVRAAAELALPFAASGCCARRADGVPAFLS